MGSRAFLTSSESSSAPRARSVDLPLMLAVGSLVLFGLIMLFSASWDFSLGAYGSPTYMFNRQLMWLGLGLVAAVTLSFVDYHLWRKWIVPIMILTLLLLIAVLLMNEIRFGAKRAFFSGSVQPSELAKLVSIIYLSVWLYAKRDQLHDISLGLIPLGVLLGIAGGLIFLQPDLSAAATLVIMGGLLFFLAGGDLKQISILIVLTVIVGWVVVQISATGQQRVGDFVAGLKDPTQSSYHVLRSFEAIVHGGVFGVGIGRADTKLTGLPVPPTDSIFAVVAEELGVLGAALLMGLYAMLIWRGLIVARRAPDMLGTLLASGLVLWIGVEAIINMAVMVGLMPFAGNALPFISAGGSSLTVSLAAVGILLNISRQQSLGAQTDDDWRSFGAVVNLRGRNGRRGISRSRRA